MIKRQKNHRILHQLRQLQATDLNPYTNPNQVLSSSTKRLRMGTPGASGNHCHVTDVVKGVVTDGQPPVDKVTRVGTGKRYSVISHPMFQVIYKATERLRMRMWHADHVKAVRG